MGLFSLANLFGITVRESANDGSDFTNPDADYRRLFLGEDGLLHVKDSSGTVTSPYTSGGGSSDAHGCRLKRTGSNFSIGNNTYTAVEFNAEDYDTDTMHDNSTAPSRITIPSISGVTTGLWHFTASGYTTGGGTRVDAVIRLGGTTQIAFVSSNDAAVASYQISCDYVLSATNYVELQLKTPGGAGSAVQDGTISPLFSAAFMGKVT